MAGTDKKELREHLPAWLQEHGLPLTRSFRCLNPAHQDHHPSMRFNPKNQTVHCFSCGATYDLFDLVGMEEHAEGFAACLEAVRRRYGSGAAERRPSSYRETEQDDFTEFARAGAAARGEDAFAWFAARGIGRRAVEEHGLFMNAGRAVFPLWENGRCVSWCARALDEGVQPRYRNSPGPMGIWGADRLREGCALLAVCEGILDALSLEACGCRALALCGAANTGRLLEAMRCLEGPLPAVILAGDADEAGQRMNDELERGLRELGAVCVRLFLPVGCKDANEALVKDRAGLEREMRRAMDAAACSGEGAPGAPAYEQDSQAGGAPEFLAYVERSRSTPVLSSGFPGLDELLGGGLFPGLYVLGAPSSLGKTTLLLQMADALTAAGRDVLFFSMEMSRWELLAKSLSRRAGLKDGATMRQILQGELDRQRLEGLLEAYNRECGGRFFVADGAPASTPEQAAQKARELRQRRGASPVVMVDYLQIMAASDPRASDKQNVDRAVLCLKALSLELDAPVLAASSFNRESYGKGASMEAFKESGAVEYAADVLLALQFTAFGKEGFDAGREKARDPRREDLILLKNRNGTAFGRVGLAYHGAANLFLEERERPAAPPKEGSGVNRIGKRR